MSRFLFLILILLVMTAAGCGTKPGSVDAPPGAEDKVFPRTYPDPSTNRSF